MSASPVPASPDSSVVYGVAAFAVVFVAALVLGLMIWGR